MGSPDSAEQRYADQTPLMPNACYNFFLSCRTNQIHLPYITSTIWKQMKETRLGEFEEVILLLVGILGQEAYAFNIAQEFESQTDRAVSIGAVHSTLTRLEGKGFLKSQMGNSTSERGGRRKRIYTITAYGRRAVEAARDLRVSLWRQYPAFVDKFTFNGC